MGGREHKNNIARESAQIAQQPIAEYESSSRKPTVKPPNRAHAARPGPPGRLRQRHPPAGESRVRCGPTHAHKTGRSMREVSTESLAVTTLLKRSDTLQRLRAITPKLRSSHIGHQGKANVPRLGDTCGPIASRNKTLTARWRIAEDMRTSMFSIARLDDTVRIATLLVT